MQIFRLSAYSPASKYTDSTKPLPLFTILVILKLKPICMSFNSTTDKLLK